MQEAILKVDWSSEKSKKKAIKMVSEDKDVLSFSVDHEKKQLTVKGDMDPVSLVKKMRKQFPTTEIVYMETLRAVEAPPQEPNNHYPYPPDHYNWGPSAPPYYGGYNSYYPPQSYPAYGHSYHPNPYNWGPPAPPYGGYNGQ